jgi:hypothetical protein
MCWLFAVSCSGWHQVRYHWGQVLHSLKMWWDLMLCSLLWVSGSSVTLTEDLMRFDAFLTAVSVWVKCYTYWESDEIWCFVHCGECLGQVLHSLRMRSELMLSSLWWVSGSSVTLTEDAMGIDAFLTVVSVWVKCYTYWGCDRNWCFPHCGECRVKCYAYWGCYRNWCFPHCGVRSSVTLTEDLMRFDAFLTVVSVRSSVTLTEDLMRFDALFTSVSVWVKCYTHWGCDGNWCFPHCGECRGQVLDLLRIWWDLMLCSLRWVSGSSVTLTEDAMGIDAFLTVVSVGVKC